MEKLARTCVWMIGDFAYLAILCVAFGFFLGSIELVFAGLLVRYVLIWKSLGAPLWMFAVSVFTTSASVYMFPLLVSQEPVITGIRDGRYGSLTGHWQAAVVAGAVACAGLVLARLITRRIGGGSAKV